MGSGKTYYLKCVDCEGVGAGATEANFTFWELHNLQPPLIFMDKDRPDFGCLCWQNGKHMTDTITRAESHLTFQYLIREGEYFIKRFFVFIYIFIIGI